MADKNVLNGSNKHPMGKKFGKHMSRVRGMEEQEFLNGSNQHEFAQTFDAKNRSKTSKIVHICIQKRNHGTSLTTVQGLKKELDYNKILTDLNKKFRCNGTVVQDREGQVIQLQGDLREKVSAYLVQNGIVKKENIKIRG